MISEFKASKALSDHLATIAGLPVLVYDNKTYTPTVGTPYMMEADYSGPTQALAVAANGFQRKDGLYVVLIYTPKGSGKWGGLAYVDKVIAGFPRGLVLTNGGQSMHIERVSREPALMVGEFYQIGVQVYYTVVV